VAAVGLPANASDPSQGPPIAFFFPYGSVVLWGFTEDESADLLAKAAAFAEGTLPPDTAAAAEDRIAFFPMAAAATSVQGPAEGFLGRPPVRSLSSEPLGASATAGASASVLAAAVAARGYGNMGGSGVDLDLETAAIAADAAGAAAVAGDAEAAASAAELAARRPAVSFARTGAYLNLADVLDPLAKLSVSYAFAQSSKLNTLEFLVEALVEDIRPIPEALAKFGKVKYSQTDAARLTGRTFLLSSAVNLYSDILDVPDFFWENDQYEPLYT
jgi:hypothetical protein